MANSIFLSVRPRHWIKNLLVFLPLIFGKKLGDFPETLKTIAVFFIFSAAAAAVYFINDIIDAERDTLHPEKRKRHIASGRISPHEAVKTALILGVPALLSSFIVDLRLGCVIAAYVALNIAYSKVLKDIVVIDVFAISCFFLLRISAGSVAAGVGLSHWIVFLTFLLALFFGLNKRRQELKAFGDEAAAAHRAVLEHYNTRLIDRMTSVVTPAIMVVYMLYTVDSQTVYNFGSTHLIYTVPFVFYGIFRYFYMIHVLRRSGDPVEMFFSDRKTQINLALWVLFCMLIIYFGV